MRIMFDNQPQDNHAQSVTITTEHRMPDGRTATVRLRVTDTGYHRQVAFTPAGAGFGPGGGSRPWFSYDDLIAEELERSGGA